MNTNYSDKMSYAPFGLFGRKWVDKKIYEFEKKYMKKKYAEWLGLTEKEAEQKWVQEQREGAKKAARLAFKREMGEKLAKRKGLPKRKGINKQRLRRGLWPI